MEPFKPEELIKKETNVEIIRKLPSSYLCEKAILGIDIYKYSQYALIEQVYVPVIFELFYKQTVALLIQHEPFIFSTYCTTLDEFKKKFISTGDGGFQIFDNPIQAIIFSIYFQVSVKRFTSGSNTNYLLKKLNELIDSIELRYSITLDLIYRYESNFFGPAIINNARILSKDSLNRFLVDHNTTKWLNHNINSVENLMELDKKSFISTTHFKNYDEKLESNLFDQKGSILSTHLLKIGAISVKNTSLDIYNLYIQALVVLIMEKHAYNKFVITLGNLNTSGIS